MGKFWTFDRTLNTAGIGAGIVLGLIGTGFTVAAYYRDQPPSSATTAPAGEAVVAPWWALTLLGLGLALLLAILVRALLTARKARDAPDEGDVLSSYAVPLSVLNPLTADQIAFRTALKQFSLRNVPLLNNLSARVLRELADKEKQVNAGTPESLTIHMFMHFALNDLGAAKVAELAGASLDSMIVVALQQELNKFFNEYSWRQRAIGNMNAIAKLDLSTMVSAQAWFEADRESVSDLQKLKIWPEAHKALTKISESEMATGPDRLWASETRVNY